MKYVPEEMVLLGFRSAYRCVTKCRAVGGIIIYAEANFKHFQLAEHRSWAGLLSSSQEVPFN